MSGTDFATPFSRIDRNEPERYDVVGATLLIWQRWKPSSKRTGSRDFRRARCGGGCHPQRGSRTLRFSGAKRCGKSTTIKMLTGLMEPSAGTIEILGQRFGPEARDLKRQIGVVPEGMALLGR